MRLFDYQYQGPRRRWTLHYDNEPLMEMEIGGHMNTAETKAPACCHIPCDKDADWVIIYTPFGLDEYTHSCSYHLGEMLTDAYEHRIYHVGSGA